MARGKHAELSATRRADAAEITADRYIAQAARWKAIAQRSQAMAELTVGLQAEVKRLRAEPTVPRATYEHDTAQLIERHATELANLESALTDVVVALANQLHPLLDGEHIGVTPQLMMGAQKLPEPCAEALWKALGLSRERRRIVTEPGFTNFARAKAKPRALGLVMVAEAAGHHGGIPMDWLVGESDDRPEWVSERRIV